MVYRLIFDGDVAASWPCYFSPLYKGSSAFASLLNHFHFVFSLVREVSLTKAPMAHLSLCDSVCLILSLLDHITSPRY